MNEFRFQIRFVYSIYNSNSIQFNSRKLGDDQIINTYFTKLAITLIRLHLKWKHINYSRKCQYIKHESSRAGFISVTGAIVGMIFCGPKGAIVGSLAGGAGSCAYSWFKSWIAFESFQKLFVTEKSCNIIQSREFCKNNVTFVPHS